MKVRLDPETNRILVAPFASPKETPAEVGRIYGIPLATVWQRIRRLQVLGLVQEVFAFVDVAGEMRRYYERSLPIDTSAEEVVVEL